MTNLDVLLSIQTELERSNLNVLTFENVSLINDEATRLLQIQEHSKYDIDCMSLLIWISNVVYNNTDRELAPLEDGVYDLLLITLRKYVPNYLVGAPVIDFKMSGSTTSEKPPMQSMIKYMDDDFVSDSLYLDFLCRQPKMVKEDSLRNQSLQEQPQSNQRRRNVSHDYPELVGTLEKCKFVLDKQAKEAGVYDQSNVQIFERDFLRKAVEDGIIDYETPFVMIAELKYDGISIEAEVSNRILSARSRGDTQNDEASDYTPVLKDFPFVRSHVPDEEAFGMKFEAIIKTDALQYLNSIREQSYVNCRNAIIGIFGSNDAYKYRDYITLVPLATSLPGMDRIEEIEFMNKYYYNGEGLRYAVLAGNYYQILYQVYRFVEEAEIFRGFAPFMYDGVVISFLDPAIVEKMGRKNSINQWQMAIKFNALKRKTIFRGYTYTVGQAGNITPMIHFNPVEFYGTIHDHCTGHSYKRFMELGLKEGDILNIEYNNDVMCYATKAECSENDNNPNLIIPFIDKCPSCGGPITISDSGKSAICENKLCPDRQLARMVNMLQKLNLKDFSEESLKAIARFSLTELMNLKREDILFLGETNSQKFIDRMNELKTQPIYDYRIVGSLGFSNIAIEKWKLILKHIPLLAIMVLPDQELKDRLVSIKGIGPSAADIIVEERELFMDDLITISQMMNIKLIMDEDEGKIIRFSGIRDKELTEQLQAQGIDISDSAGVSKNTDILIVPHDGFTSTKTQKAVSNGTTVIVSLDEFKANMDKYLS